VKIIILRIFGVIAVTAIAKEILLWLGTKHGIYPEQWIAQLLGLAEEGVHSYPSISWTLAGVIGLMGIFLYPYLYKLGINTFNHQF
jgi:hypothetical protein